MSVLIINALVFIINLSLLIINKGLFINKPGLMIPCNTEIFSLARDAELLFRVDYIMHIELVCKCLGLLVWFGSINALPRTGSTVYLGKCRRLRLMILFGAPHSSREESPLWTLFISDWKLLFRGAIVHIKRHSIEWIAS